MFSFCWSVGGTTDLTGRTRFDKWLRERMAKHQVTFPEENTVYDWHFNPDKNEW